MILTPEMFKALALPSRETKHSQNSYRVYSDDKNFVTVEGCNAQEVLEKCDVKLPRRIVRDDILISSIVQHSAMKNDSAVATDPAQHPVSAEPAQQAQPIQQAAPTLSNDDVDKLLKN